MRLGNGKLVVARRKGATAAEDIGRDGIEMSLEIYNAVFNGECRRSVTLPAARGLASIVIFVVPRRNSRPALR